MMQATNAGMLEVRSAAVMHLPAIADMLTQMPYPLCSSRWSVSRPHPLWKCPCV